MQPETAKTQKTQDQIFMKMSADKKLEVASFLWRLAKDLLGDRPVSDLFDFHLGSDSRLARQYIYHETKRTNRPKAYFN